MGILKKIAKTLYADFKDSIAGDDSYSDYRERNCLICSYYDDGYATAYCRCYGRHEEPDEKESENPFNRPMRLTRNYRDCACPYFQKR